MGRPKKSAPKYVEPEDISQDVPDEEPASFTEPKPRGVMSKADACRAALAAGVDSTEEALEFTRKEFGVEIKPTDFQLYKSKAKPGRKSKAPAPAVPDGYLAPPKKPKAAGEPDVLLALEGVKELVGQFGADRVKRMVDLLG